MYHTIIKTLIFALNAKTGCASEVKKTSFFVILSACTIFALNAKIGLSYLRPQI